MINSGRAFMSRARTRQMRASLRAFKHAQSFLPGKKSTFLNHSEGATRFINVQEIIFSLSLPLTRASLWTFWQQFQNSINEKQGRKCET